MGKSLAFAGLCFVCIGTAVAYVIVSGASRRSDAPSTAVSTVADPRAVAEIARRPHLMFLSTQPDKTLGKVGLVPLDQLDGPRYLTNVSCDRVHFAEGLGLCLAADRGFTTHYRADLFDGRFQIRQTQPLAGIPSRARVAPDGRLAALTVFVTGDSYSAGSFSTRTLLLDSARGKTLGDLEQFAVSRNGALFKAVDFNFWGVTFAKQPGVFYATLASGRKTYLVEGNASTKTARVLRENVECPSLSPDNRRIAFKRRQPGFPVRWRIHVLDLTSGQETALAETRSVDDQVEWLDDREIIYALFDNPLKASARMHIWAAAADGSGPPRLLLAEARSPAVVRVATDHDGR